MTPRELARSAEGYRWRDERDWEKRAVEIAFALQPWSSKSISPQQILDAIHGKSDDTDFEHMAGLDDPGAVLDAMLAKQAERKKGG